MHRSRRVRDENVFDVFQQLSDPTEALSTNEVAEALDCARRTAYKYLSELAEAGRLNTKKVGPQVRIWWLPMGSDDEMMTAGDGVTDLTEDHVIQFEFQSEQIASSLREVGGPNMQISVDGVVTLDDDTQLQYWTITGIDPRTHIEILEGRPSVIDVRLLSTVGDTFRVEIHSDVQSLFAAFARFDGRLTSGYFEENDINIVAEFPATVDAEAVVETARESYPDIELVSQRLVSTQRLFCSLAEERLSDRQWTAFQMAYFAGFYEQPRQSSGQDLAERMDISKQTFHHHIREAEGTVADILLNGLDEEHNTVAQSVRAAGAD